MSKVFLPILALGSLGSLLLTKSTAAQTIPEQQIAQLKTVVVTATRGDQAPDEVNRPLTVIEREQLDEIQAQSVAEAAAYQPNVSVSGGAIPGNQQINIRGLSDNKVLQVIDGARNNVTFAHRPSYFLDPELLRSVEILKGPSSSLWGSGAIGGVVVQNTISARDLITEDNTQGGFIKSGYQDNGDGWAHTAGFATQQNGFDTLIAANFRHNDEMEQGGGNTLYGSDSQNKTVLGKLGWDLDKQERLALQFRHADLDNHPPTVGSADDQLNDPSQLINRRVTDTHFAIDYATAGKTDWVDLTSKLYISDTDNEEITTFGGGDRSDIKTVGFNVINTTRFGHTRLLMGIDGYRDTVNVTRAVNSGSTNRPEPPTEAKTWVYGTFASLTHDVNQQWQLEAGLRYDNFETEANNNANKSEEDAFSPSAAVRWQATDWMRWTVRYEEAFRAPTSYELYIEGTHFAYAPIPGWVNSFVANPDLKPEKAENKEVSVDFLFDDLFSAKDQLTLNITGFINDLEDFIYLNVVTNPGVPVTGTSTHVNAQDAQIKGYEVSAQYAQGPLNVNLAYSQARGTEVTNIGATPVENYLQDIPADKWVLDINYGLWNIDTKIGMRVVNVDEQDRLPPPSSGSQIGPYNSYTLTDFYATWEPTSGNLEGLKLDFALINAFDKNYRVAWSEVYEPGRAARIAARYSF